MQPLLIECEFITHELLYECIENQCLIQVFLIEQGYHV